MTPHECRSQLDWSAFCYLVGEMTPADAAEFEALLGDDQSAREALARAVELTQVVAAAEAQRTDAQRGAVVVRAARSTADWSTRLSWMAVGGLASLLVALLWAGAIGPTWKTALRAMHSGGQRELAAAWTETRAELANVREVGLWPSGAAIGGDADDDAAVAGDWLIDDVAIDDAPSWMTAALFGIAGESPDAADGAAQRERLEN